MVEHEYIIEANINAGFFDHMLVTKHGAYLSKEGLLVGHFIFQLVVEVVHGGGLPLSCQVALLQGGDPLLHVFLLSHRLYIHNSNIRVLSQCDPEHKPTFLLAWQRK